MRALRLLTAAAALTSLLATPAAAAPTPGASYGGGSFSGKVKRPVLPSARLSIGVDARAASARIVGLVTVPCRGGVSGITQEIDASAPLDPGGAFRGDARTSYYLFGSEARKPRGRATFDVVVDGPAARGTIRVRVNYRRKGRRVRCEGTVPLELRSVATDDSAPTGAGADGFLFGTSTGRYRGVATPVALWFTRGGTRLEVSLNGAEVRCGDGLRLLLSNFSPAARLTPAGTFSIRERYGFRFKDATSTTTVRLRGQLTAQGVRGTFEINDRVRFRGSRRIVRCRSGVTRFAAVR